MSWFGHRRHRAVPGAAGSGPDQLLAPVGGELVALSDLPDPVFSSGAIGPGVGVTPSGPEIRSPLAGRVVTVFHTGHAYGIRAEDGTEVLVHVGINTVELGGRGFTPRVAQGDAVVAGDLLATIDVATIRAAGYDPTTIVVLLNPGNFSGVVVAASPGVVAPGSPVVELRR